ncbi:hypothetical protein WMF20_37145 [Sorangium sp. So ce834]|uniref:hypothetical protein n=1 Tax=Sorangium sp. So ce834 TaxID=3133321 RepID=UPI003F641EA6
MRNRCVSYDPTQAHAERLEGATAHPLKQAQTDPAATRPRAVHVRATETTLTGVAGLVGFGVFLRERWMKLVAMVTEPRNIVRFLCALGEPTDVPARSPNREPPYWKSTVVRRKALGDVA